MELKKYKMKSTTYFFALLLFVMPFLSSAQIKAKKNNVLLIVVDDLNTSLGCYGNKEVKTPNIDRLAAMGVMFDRAYCQYPLCNPSRVSFLSGKRPENTGVYVLNVPARKALPDAVLLPQYFKNQGYYTAGAGKVFHNAKMSDGLSWNYYTDEASIDAEEKAAIDTRYGGGDGRPKAYVLTTDGSKTRDGLNTKTIKDLLAHIQSRHMNIKTIQHGSSSVKKLSATAFSRRFKYGAFPRNDKGSARFYSPLFIHG